MYPMREFQQPGQFGLRRAPVRRLPMNMSALGRDVYHGRADPAAKALLCTIEDRVHHARCLVRRLHAVQALTRVA